MAIKYEARLNLPKCNRMLKFDNFLIICITFFQDDDDDENGEQETPRLVWSMGLKCDKAKCLLMRLATKSESC